MTSRRSLKIKSMQCSGPLFMPPSERYPLREAEIVASGRDGLQKLASEDVVALVLGKVKLCTHRVSDIEGHTAREVEGGGWDIRLKQV